MMSIFYKNFLYYKRNFGELISLLLSFFLEIIPLFFMVYMVDNKDNLDKFIVVFFYLIGCLIVNVSIGVCFEYYREIIYKHNFDYKLARISKIEYLISQTIFYVFLNIWAIIVSLISIYFIRPFEFTNSMHFINYLLLFINLVLFLFILSSVSCLFAFIIKKTGVFSVGGLMCNIMLLFSTCYTPLEEIPVYARFLVYLNPFFYFIDGIRSNIFGINHMSLSQYIPTIVFIVYAAASIVVFKVFRNKEDF